MKMRMRRMGLTGLMLAALATTASLLTSAPTVKAQTNTTTDNPINDLLGTNVFPSSLTNINLTLGGDYIKSTKQVGEFAMLSYNLPLGDRVGAGLGAGIDHFGKNTYSLSGQVSLKADVYAFGFLGTNNAVTRALSSQLFTPGAYVGMGTPFGGGQNTQLETIEAAFVSWHPNVAVLGGILNITGLYGTRQNAGDASGQFFGGAAGLTWKF